MREQEPLNSVREHLHVVQHFGYCGRLFFFLLLFFYFLIVCAANR